MNKEQPKQFSFLYPVTDKRVIPAKHLIDLHICGNVEIGRLKETLSIHILKINHIAKGERFASDIKEFLRYANYGLYKEIEQAALSHATDKFELQPYI